MVLTRRVAFSGALAAGLSRAMPGHAEESAPLYQATAIVTGTDMRQRPLGFSRCLTEVLVKLTGAPQLAGDPAVAALASHAEAFVASFTYVDPRAGLLHHDDQGTYDRSQELTVAFDPAKIDAALAQLGREKWPTPRPLLVPAILVRDREPVPFLLSSTAPRGNDMRQTMVQLGSAFGIGVRFPTEADFAAWAVGLIGFPAPLAGSAGGEAQVPGTLSWSVHAMGWVGSWRMNVQGKQHSWDISGVGFDEALGNMVRGAVMLLAGTGVP